MHVGIILVLLLKNVNNFFISQKVKKKEELLFSNVHVLHLLEYQHRLFMQMQHTCI